MCPGVCMFVRMCVSSVLSCVVDMQMCVCVRVCMPAAGMTISSSSEEMNRRLPRTAAAKSLQKQIKRVFPKLLLRRYISSVTQKGPPLSLFMQQDG